jgi:hypothetical protein
MGGSSGGLQGYASSPQQDAVYSALMPLLKKMTSGAMSGTPYANIPDAPLPDYQIPSAVGPTKDMWDQTDPHVMAGIEAPWNVAQKQMEEAMGGGGTAGSARAGASGAMGSAYGRFFNDKAESVGTQWWNMMSPGLNNVWSAQLQQNQIPYQNQLTQWNLENQQLMGPFQNATSMMPSTFPNPIISQSSAGTDWGGMLSGVAGIGSALSGSPLGLTSLAAKSSIRHKTNIRKLGSIDGLDVISFNYHWSPVAHIGFIAEQVNEKYPEAVFHDKQGRVDGIYYGILLPLLGG